MNKYVRYGLRALQFVFFAALAVAAVGAFIWASYTGKLNEVRTWRVICSYFSEYDAVEGLGVGRRSRAVGRYHRRWAVDTDGMTKRTFRPILVTGVVVVCCHKSGCSYFVLHC